jgi:hypothetical protein
MRYERTLATVVIVIGLVALAVCVIYLTVEAKSLPSIMGTLHRDTGHRTKRGIAAGIVGVILLLGGSGLLAYRPRSVRRR